ncbi:43682_t:CDS:1, partial [Gigaspora margarita]
KKTHKFIDYIEVLDEKADEWRNYAICRAYHDAVGKATAILKKFPNKSERAKNHLKKCQHFMDKQGSIEAASTILEINLEEEDDKSDIDNNTKRP